MIEDVSDEDLDDEGEQGVPLYVMDPTCPALLFVLLLFMSMPQLGCKPLQDPTDALACCVASVVPRAWGSCADAHVRQQHLWSAVSQV